MRNIGKNRNGIIDIYRFVMALCIMMYHSNCLDGITKYPFMRTTCGGGDIFVEAFFLLSGYFVTKSVEKNKLGVLQNSLKSDVIYAFKYTWNKYKVFLPYTFIAVFVTIIIKHVIILDDFNFSMIIKGILEACMIIRGDSNIGVLWYMAAMLPVLPIMIVIEKRISNDLYTILALIAVVGWYFCLGCIKDVLVVMAPLSYLRGVAGLSLGILTFWIQKKTEKLINKKNLINCLNIIMFASLIIPVCLGAVNISINMIQLLLFITGFALCFNSYTIQIRGNELTSFMSKYSFLLYIVHLNMGYFTAFISRECVKLSIKQQYICWFLSTIIAILILECLKKWVQYIYDWCKKCFEN